MSIERLSSPDVGLRSSLSPEGDDRRPYSEEQISSTLALRATARVLTADWREQAACRNPEVDKRLFFSDSNVEKNQAIEVCDTCPVKQECLDYALERPKEIGVWGGTTERQRMRLRRHYSRKVSGGTV